MNPGRREAIQKTALTLGYIISAPALTSILNACKPSDTAYASVFLNAQQSLIVAEIAEIIIPKTDTPGAKDVGIAGFMDAMIKETFPKEEQDRFLKELTDFDKEAETSYGKAFVDCSPVQQKELVKKHHDAAMQGKNAQKPLIMTVKELTIIGFFTSEQGATQVLQYNPSPGPYKGCVPLSEVGKTWAT